MSDHAIRIYFHFLLYSMSPTEWLLRKVLCFYMILSISSLDGSGIEDLIFHLIYKCLYCYLYTPSKESDSSDSSPGIWSIILCRASRLSSDLVNLWNRQFVKDWGFALPTAPLDNWVYVLFKYDTVFYTLKCIYFKSLYCRDNKYINIFTLCI